MHISLPANCLTPNQHPSVAFTFQIILLAGADNKVSGNASTETDNSLASPANDFSRLIRGVKDIYLSRIYIEIVF